MGTQAGGATAYSPLAICVVQGSVPGEAWVLILGFDDVSFVSFSVVRPGLVAQVMYAFIGKKMPNGRSSAVILAMLPELEVDPRGGYVVTGRLVFTPPELIGKPPFTSKRALIGHIE